MFWVDMYDSTRELFGTGVHSRVVVVENELMSVVGSSDEGGKDVLKTTVVCEKGVESEHPAK